MVVYLKNASRNIDHRGFFGQTYSQQRYAGMGVEGDFLKVYHSLSRLFGTLRGLDFQAPPVAQGKLVRRGPGVIFDIAVDIRRGSPSYCQWEGLEETVHWYLENEDWWQPLLDRSGVGRRLGTKS